MEEGNLSDARGRGVDFCNTIVIMTSNVGAEMIKRGTSLGFVMPHDETADARRDYEEMRKKLLGELKRIFRPEFLNRVDTVVVFHALSRDEIAQIVGLELDKVSARLVEYNMGLEVTEAAKALLAEEGYSEEYGARPLRRVIQNRIEDALSDAMLAHKFVAGDTVLVDAEEGEIRLRQAEETVRELVMEPVPA
jgi:ATP-dependent Clp protease ATP-binding subunit ClpC